MKWNRKGHQFDYIGRHFRKRNKLFVYGAAEMGKEFLDRLEKIGLLDMVDGFIDRDVQKQAEGFEGRPVLSPDIVFQEYEEHHLIIVAMHEPVCSWILDRLQQAGYIENLDYFHWDTFWIHLNEPYLPLYALYTQDKVIISSSCCIPGDTCNLRCKHCLNFTPYIEHFETRELQEVCEDMDLFFKWIDFTFRHQISGGEPLLYPYLKELIEYIGTHYRNKIDVFEIVINGTNVPSDQLCKCMNKYGMTVYLDNYVQTISPEQNYREEIIRQLEMHQVNWVDNTVEDWFDLDIFHTDHSDMSEEELTEYFDHCSNPWHYYERGKIYACNFAKFAERAGLNQENESACFDLSCMNAGRKAELVEFLLNYNDQGYVQLCKHCAGYWDHINPKRVPVAIQMER
ncbi:MAG: hypothetical protein HFE76_12205 [Firmicutes bacterium]|nr:hypothetical protein [Bacillota bacterium]